MASLDQRPHIVHILGTLGAGGAQRMVLQLATGSELQAFRHSVICIIAKEGELLESYMSHGIQVYSCPVRWPVSTPIPSYRLNRWLRDHLVFTFPWRLNALLHRIKANLVDTHVTTPDIHLQAYAVLSLAHLPWVWTVRGLYRSRGEDASKWGRVVRAINSSPAAAVTAVSRAALNEVLTEPELSPHKAHVIQNGIDLAKFEPKDLPDLHLREKWGIPPDVLVFGTAGRLIPVKRMDVFIDAAAILIRNGSTAHFVIAGEGALRERLSDHIDQTGFHDRIHLIGYQKDIPAFLGALDVFVLASDSEGMPNALLEACAMRLPCIATAVGGVCEFLSDGTGILIQPGCAVELANAMQQMFSPALGKSYARKARSVAEEFSNEKMCKSYASLYRDLLNTV